MASSSTSVPLHCSVCPKKPTFSDVSHLLTHVASKGHLSHYYKLKVRATQDLTARTLVDQYDLWYDQWGVEELMSQRMHQKEKKRSRSRTQALPPTFHPKHDDENKTNVVLNETNGFGRAANKKRVRSAFVDDLDGDVPSSPPLGRARLHLWDTYRPGSYEAIPLDSSSPTPEHSSLATDIIERRSTDNSAESMDATLKGVIWPGMALFDASLPDMRRKRNQKKDPSVLDRLEQNSRKIEPVEVVSCPLGNIRKQRPITGRVASSSPELASLSPEPPPRKKSKQRHPLGDRDVNSTISGAHRNRPYRPLVGGAAATRQRTTHRRRNASFPVHQDNEERAGYTEGMSVLNSEFRPTQRSTSSVFNAHRGYTPAGPTYPYLPYDMAAMFGANGMLPVHQPLYGPPELSYYSQHGYELPTFFAAHMQEHPFSRLRSNNDVHSSQVGAASQVGADPAHEDHEDADTPTTYSFGATSHRTSTTQSYQTGLTHSTDLTRTQSYETNMSDSMQSTIAQDDKKYNWMGPHSHEQDASTTEGTAAALHHPIIDQGYDGTLDDIIGLADEDQDMMQTSEFQPMLSQD